MSDLYLVHHGIKGQKWGIRRWQHDDGSVTPAGAERYYVGGKRAAGTNGGSFNPFNRKAQLERKSDRLQKKAERLNQRSEKMQAKLKRQSEKAKKESETAQEGLSKEQKKKAATIAVAALGTAAVAAGAVIVGKKLHAQHVEKMTMAAVEKATKAWERDQESFWKLARAMSDMGMNVTSMTYTKTIQDFM